MSWPWKSYPNHASALGGSRLFSNSAEPGMVGSTELNHWGAMAMMSITTMNASGIQNIARPRRSRHASPHRPRGFSPAGAAPGAGVGRVGDSAASSAMPMLGSVKADPRVQDPVQQVDQQV